MRLEERKGSWDFAQEFHTRCGKRRERGGENVGEKTSGSKRDVTGESES